MQAVADLGEGARGPRAPPLFVDQAEAQRAKIDFGDAPTPPPPLPLYLKGWIRYWQV